jgi:hypothetical protein
VSTRPVIRRALSGERAGVVATVAAAFAEDRGWAFILGEELATEEALLHRIPIQASRPSSLEVLLSAESTTLAESVPFPPQHHDPRALRTGVVGRIRSRP